jgi:hypothetical protein
LTPILGWEKQVKNLRTVHFGLKTQNEQGDKLKASGLYKVQQTQDEGFVMCGFAHTIVDVPVSSASDTWILKVDKYGCEIPVCVTSIEEPTQPEPPKEETYFEVYPNPSSGVVNVEWNPSVGSGLLEVLNRSIPKKSCHV